MQKKLVSLAVQGAVLGASLAIPQFTFAQSGAALEEVVVTARKVS